MEKKRVSKGKREVSLDSKKNRIDLQATRAAKIRTIKNRIRRRQPEIMERLSEKQGRPGQQGQNTGKIRLRTGNLSGRRRSYRTASKEQGNNKKTDAVAKETYINLNGRSGKKGVYRHENDQLCVQEHTEQGVDQRVSSRDETWKDICGEDDVTAVSSLDGEQKEKIAYHHENDAISVRRHMERSVDQRRGFRNEIRKDVPNDDMTAVYPPERQQKEKSVYHHENDTIEHTEQSADQRVSSWDEIWKDVCGEEDVTAVSLPEGQQKGKEEVLEPETKPKMRQHTPQNSQKMPVVSETQKPIQTSDSPYRNGTSNESRYHHQSENGYKKNRRLRSCGKKPFYHAASTVKSTARTTGQKTRQVIEQLDEVTQNDGKDQQATQMAMEKTINQVMQTEAKAIGYTVSFSVRKSLQLIRNIPRLIRAAIVLVRYAIALVRSVVALICSLPALVVVVCFVVILLIAVIASSVQTAYDNSPLAWLEGLFNHSSDNIYTYISDQVDAVWKEIGDEESTSEAFMTYTFINGKQQGQLDNRYDIAIAYMAYWSQYAYELPDDEDSYGYGVVDNANSILAGGDYVSDYNQMIALTDENKSRVDEIISQMLTYTAIDQRIRLNSSTFLDYKIIKVNVHSYDCFEANNSFTDMQHNNGQAFAALALQTGEYDVHEVVLHPVANRLMLQQFIENAEGQTKELLQALQDTHGADVSADPDCSTDELYTEASWSYELIKNFAGMDTSSSQLIAQVNALKAANKMEDYETDALRVGDMLFYMGNDSHYTYVKAVYVYVGQDSDGTYYCLSARPEYGEVCLTELPEGATYVCHLVDEEEED